ncbi:DUF4059 family protein [Lactococcus termiticola]|uniref:Uncharacterized protein n=1 Tax=Lactococcus termiticola TaxID=2169526 RepID=A0A2R5HFZ1_9LACT|nr:DUF4059 family protein [Lactococcus termiticola]GBG96756.1 hypothetical protein NtB2_00880 [Lactococcus termiticola]
MFGLILELYIQGLIFSFILIAVLCGLYIFAFLVRNPEKSRAERRNRVMDAILVAVLTIPILSFALLGFLVILRAKHL